MDQIVIVEDDIFLRSELQNTLEKEGYAVWCISSFHNVIEEIININPNLILLDLNLPQISGYDICKGLKAKGIGPILVLTSRDQLRDEIHALDLGADDYLTKPCHPDRLLARIQKLISLYSNLNILLEAGDIKLEEKTNTLYFNGKTVTLSENEGIIMKILIKADSSVVRKEELFREIWGSTEYVDENILQVNMTRLRKTLESIGIRNKIKTIRGVGYKLEGADKE